MRHMHADAKQLHNLSLEGILSSEITIANVDRQAFTPNEFYILFIIIGSLKAEVNDVMYYLCSNDIIIIPPGFCCQLSEPDIQLHIYSCRYTEEFSIRQMVQRPLIASFNLHISNSVLLLNLLPEQLSAVKSAYRSLHDKLNKASTPHRYQVAELSYNLLIYEIADVHANCAGYNPHGYNEKLVLQFLKVLRQNFRKQHSVQFYADSLYVSAGHLTKVIKQVCRKTVKQLIEESLISEAKILLSNRELSIMDITDELEFSTISFFSSFFKKHTDITPTTFRREATSTKLEAS